jgi:transposase
MHDRELYARILGVTVPWRVEDVELKAQEGEIHVRLGWERGSTFRCPECGVPCPTYDSRERNWRHLDTCQYRTYLHAAVPRVECPTHGVRQIGVPWAESGSQFTALFEGLAIDWMKAASLSAVARQLQMSWDEAWGIMQRAVRRGLARREPEVVPHLGVDEKSRHLFPLWGIGPTPGKDLVVFAGAIETNDLAKIVQAIEEDCEQVDPGAW